MARCAAATRSWLPAPAAPAGLNHPLPAGAVRSPRTAKAYPQHFAAIAKPIAHDPAHLVGLDRLPALASGKVMEPAVNGASWLAVAVTLAWVDHDNRSRSDPLAGAERITLCPPKAGLKWVLPIAAAPTGVLVRRRRVRRTVAPQ